MKQHSISTLFSWNMDIQPSFHFYSICLNMSNLLPQQEKLQETTLVPKMCIHNCSQYNPKTLL